MPRVLLDNASGTPLLPEVRQAMTAALEQAGNPSSLHAEGRAARQSMTKARAQVASLIHAKPDEIVFTSCGTESNNWAIKGLLAANKRKGNHLIVSSIEHPSVLLIAKRLEREGADVTYLPVDGKGRASPESLRAAMTPTTALVSIMHANGEVGTIQPIAELSRIAHDGGALFHADAIASAGWAPLDVATLGADALSLAANQFHGPSGVAALYVRSGARILPLLEGGGQEVGMRSGTENLPGIVGMGQAAELAIARLSTGETARIAQLRDRLRDGLLARIEDVRLNGSWSHRLPHHLHVCFHGASSESLILGLDQAGIAAGIGSACNSKTMRPSHVLKAMGLSDDEAMGATLFTLSALTTQAEIDQAIERLPGVVERLRRVTALTAAR